MAEIGSAYLTVIPSLKGAQKSITSQLSGIDTTGVGKSMGQTMGGGVSSGLSVAKVAIGNTLASVASAGISSITSHLDSAISRVDTLNSFPRVMENIGYSTDEAEDAISKLSEGVTGLPTSLDEIAASAQGFTMSLGDLGQATDFTLALNDGLIAFNASAEGAASASEMMDKMISANSFTTERWRAVNAEASGMLDVVAQKLLGASAGNEQLRQALNDGTVSVDDFTQAFVDLDKNGMDSVNAFSDSARTASGGIQTAFTNLSTAVTRSMGNVIDALNGDDRIIEITSGISDAIDDMGDGIVTVVEDWVVPAVEDMMDWWDDFSTTVTDNVDWDGIKTALSDLGTAVGNVFSDENKNTAQTFGEGVANAINGLIPVIEFATPIIEDIAKAIEWFLENSDTLVPIIGGVAGAFALFKVCETIAGPISSVVNVIGTIVGKCAGSAGALAATAAGEEAVGTASAGSASQTLAMAAAVIALGAGIALACAGLWLLSQAAVTIADSGAGAAIAMGAMVAVIAGLAVGAAALGPALTAGAVGMVAFGAAVLMVGLGIGLACAGLTLLCTQLPTIVAFGAPAALGLMQIGTAALVASPGLLAAGAAALVFGAGGVVAGAAALVLGAGLTLCAAMAPICASSFMLMAMVAPGLASALPGVGAGALTAAGGLAALMVPLAACAIPLGLYAAAMWPAAENTEKFGYWMVEAAGAIGLINACLPQMRDNAQPAADALGTMAAAGEAAAPSLQVTADAMAPMATAFTMAATASMTTATAMLSMVTSVQTLSDSVNAMSAAAIVAFGNLSMAAMSNCNAAAATIKSFVTEAEDAVKNMKLQMPKIEVGPLPHFSLKGDWNTKTGKGPEPKVDWYAAGGIATEATLAGIGEAGPEAILPLKSSTLAEIGKAAVEASDEDTHGAQTVALLAQLIEVTRNGLTMDGRKMTREISRRQAQSSALYAKKGA